MEIESIILALKRAEQKIHFGITGGGTAAISMLLEEGGASGCFLGAKIPYSDVELRAAMNHTVFDKASSYSVADGLARCGDASTPHIGIGATCSLAKVGGEREGREHSIYISAGAMKMVPIPNSDKQASVATYLCNAKVVLCGRRTRKQEEDIAAKLILSFADCYSNYASQHPLMFEPWKKMIGLGPIDTVELKVFK